MVLRRECLDDRLDYNNCLRSICIEKRRHSYRYEREVVCVVISGENENFVPEAHSTDNLINVLYIVPALCSERKVGV